MHDWESGLWPPQTCTHTCINNPWRGPVTASSLMLTDSYVVMMQLLFMCPFVYEKHKIPQHCVKHTTNNVSPASFCPTSFCVVLVRNGPLSHFWSTGMQKDICQLTVPDITIMAWTRLWKHSIHGWDNLH